MPPLANAHDHVRGVRPASLGAFDLPLELWLLSLTGLPPVDPRLVTAAALGRQARGGLGSIMIHYVRPQYPDRLAHELRTVAAAAREVGVRVAIAVAMRDQNPLGYGPDAAFLGALDPAARALVESKLLRSPAPAETQVALVEALAAEVEVMASPSNTARMDWNGARRDAAPGRRTVGGDRAPRPHAPPGIAAAARVSGRGRTRTARCASWTKSVCCHHGSRSPMRPSSARTRWRSWLNAG